MAMKYFLIWIGMVLLIGYSLILIFYYMGKSAHKQYNQRRFDFDRVHEDIKTADSIMIIEKIYYINKLPVSTDSIMLKRGK